MIRIFEPYLSKNLGSQIKKIVDDNWISSQGEKVKEFENKFSNLTGIKYCLAVSSCTTALHLSLSCLGLKSNDEVICPDLTFIAPANMILQTGAKLVLVDVDQKTLTLDIVDLKKKITSKTKAIILVHTFGHACKIDEIKKIVKNKNIKIIEDVAEAFMGEYKKKKLGTFGDFACFSFFANKIITTGEGGMIATNNKKLYTHAKILRDHGMSLKKRYFYIKSGFNYRMTNIQASIGISQLENFEEINKLRNRQMKYYYDLLGQSKYFDLRNFAKFTTPVHWLMTIHLKNSKVRNKLIKYLFQKGIETRPMINPVHKSLFLRKKYKNLAINNSEIISTRSLHLPSSTALSIKQLNFICNNINNFF